MTLLLFLKLSAAVISVALGAGILARDHGLAANRLMAAFLFCNAWWASCEFHLYKTHDPELALQLFRWMSIGWVPLGVLGMHASLSLSPMADHPISRTTRYYYAALAVALPFAVATGWAMVSVERMEIGWRPIFGPGFLVLYVLVVTPLVSILVSWRRLMARAGRGGHHELARTIFFGVSAALVLGTITAVIGPLAGVAAVGVTTTLLALVGVAAAGTLRRFGYSLISPEAFSREIFDTLEDGVVVVGQGGVVRDFNPAFARMAAVQPTSVRGRPITDWLPSCPRRIEELASSTFMEIWRRDESPVPVVVSAPVPITDRGRAFGHALLLRDRQEVVSLQRQLAVSGRLAAVGDLSRSISESIREPALETRRQLEALAKDWQELERWVDSGRFVGDCAEAVREGKELIEECIEGVGRVTTIVEEVGSFSPDARPAGLAPHSLASIVESALRIARTQALPHVDIEASLDHDVEVFGHRAELERVVTNLLVNALHALEGQAPEPAHLVVAVGAQGGRALLHVEDDGCGIPPEVMERVFDPFFTTKPVGKGTGLGLAISYHIVRKHGGEIRVSSIESRGTSVAVELPRLRRSVD